MNISIYIIPFLILCLLVFASYKKVDCYNCFADGAVKTFDLIKSTFPFIAAVIIAVTLLRESGAIGFIVEHTSFIFSSLGIPSEVVELVFLRPFTGSGSIAITKNIVETYTVDSYIARCACTIAGSSETVFYVSSVYFSKTSVKKLGYAIPVALITSFLSAILACFFCRIF